VSEGLWPRLVEVAVMVPAILSATMPSPFDVDPAARRDAHTARVGEVLGGGMVLALGIAMSVDDRSILPIVLVVLVGSVWVGLTEWALMAPPVGKGDMRNV